MDKEIIKKYSHLFKTLSGLNITISSETHIFTNLSDEIIDKIYWYLEVIDDDVDYIPYNFPCNDIKMNKHILYSDPTCFYRNVDMYDYYFYNNNALYRILKCRYSHGIVLSKYGVLDEILPFIEKQENIIKKLKNEIVELNCRPPNIGGQEYLLAKEHYESYRKN